jgi:hypothetical protein
VSRPGARGLLWLLAASFALHEAEEWNLVAWERAHFTPAPDFDDAGARTLLVLFAALALAFTGIALRWLGTRRALLVLLPFFLVIVLGNALTHVFWLFFFGGYAPGVATAALLLVPLTVALVRSVLRDGLAPRGYVLGLLALAPLQPLAAAAAGDTLSESQLALQRLAMRLAAWLWGSP